MSTGILQPPAPESSGSVFAWLDYYTSKTTAIVSVTLTAMDIPKADLSEPLVLFWHRQANSWACFHSSQTHWAISHSYLDHSEMGGRKCSDLGLGCCHDRFRHTSSFLFIL